MMVYIVCISIVLLFSFGNIWQKQGLVASTRAQNFVARVLSNKCWWLGIFSSAIGSIALLYAMAEWNLSLVQSLMVLNPIITAILGRFFFKEHLSRAIKMAILFGAIGLVFLALNPQNQESNLDDFYTSIPIIALAMTYGLLKIKVNIEFRQALLSGWCFGWYSIVYKAVTLKVDFTHFSWDKMLSSDCILMLLCLLFYIMGFLFSQSALHIGRASFVVPLIALFGSTIPILGGIVLFSEGFGLLALIGLVFLSIGLLFFLPRRPRSNLYS